MMNRIEYTCQAVINERLIEDTVIAVSEAQAYYFYCKNHSFKNRDFKIIGRQAIIEQMTFNI